MTPKEKAFELYYEFSKRIDFIDNQLELDIATKKCALLAVDEIMGIIDAEDHVILYNYWQQVKQEIEKL